MSQEIFRRHQGDDFSLCG